MTDYENVLRGLPEPSTPLEVLQACSSLEVGITSLVAVLKSTNERSLEVLQDQQRSRQELARALEVVAAAITRQATGVESLVAGVGYNTSRVGAVTGEFQKLRKWIEWMSPKSLEDYHTQSSKLTKEQGEKVTQILGVLTTEIKGMSESVVAELKSLQELIQATLSTAPESTSAGEPGGMGTIRGGPEEMSSRVAPNVSG